MSPASKSKAKDRSAARAAKESTKVSSKPSAAAPNGGGGAPPSAYNPISGTFHALEVTEPDSMPLAQNNGRFRTIDETEEHAGSFLGATGEFDAASNNDSCSEESEELKEKTSSATLRVEPVPGGDIDKRDKIRQKNERKHQRQKERRSHELHERCTGYLMSRKLEVLAQQLVAMGFSSEQATMALIQNEGQLEESVTWLFEGGEENKLQDAANLQCGANLKIDITDELAGIVDMEVRFKCTRQEVERAIVACEGDLSKAEETLKAKRQEATDSPPRTPPRSGDLVDPNCPTNQAPAAQNQTARSQLRGAASAGIQQQRKGERELDTAKSLVNGTAPHELVLKSLQSLGRLPLNPDRGRPQPQVAANLEKRLLGANSTPVVSYASSPASSVLVPPVKSDAQACHVMAGNEVKGNVQMGPSREPLIVMQRPQSINGKQQSLPSTSLGISPPASMGRYANGVLGMDTKMANGSLGHNGLRGLGMNGTTTPQQFVPQNHLQNFVLNSPEQQAAISWGNSVGLVGTSPPLRSVPSSFGLFAVRGSGSSATSHRDWSAKGLMSCDYTAIDWSWSQDTAFFKSSAKSNQQPSNTWSTMFMGGKGVREGINGGGLYAAGLQDSSNLVADSTASAGSQEWTSPFSARDLLRASRKLVTSPLL